jgi:hypothetical protein
MFIQSPIELSYRHGVPFVIWCYWEGGEMSPNRKKSFDFLMQHIEVPIALITRENLSKFIKPDYPLPEAFEYISIVHRSDYIRAYLMHHYGGGWHDIKATLVSYKSVWDEFVDPKIWIIGRKEIQKGAAKVLDEYGNFIPDHYQDLIAVPSWVARSNTLLSKEILVGIENILAQNLDCLKENPAIHPREKKLPKGNIFKEIFNIIKFKYQKRSTKYPLEWTLFGNVFHPKILKYKQHISFSLPVDQEKNAGIYHRN